MNILQGKNVFDVTGKVVIVTGAATGLGEGYAHIFAESGCKVLVPILTSRKRKIRPPTSGAREGKRRHSG